MGTAVGINQRVKLAADTVTKIVNDRQLMLLHAQQMKYSNSGHLRIRIDVLLTRPEIQLLREQLAEAIKNYPRVLIDNNEWTTRWFIRRKGLEVKLFFNPYDKSLDKGVWQTPEWYRRANPKPPRR